MATQTAPSGTRWRALGALLRPDAWRWVGLGALVAISSALLITGPLIVRQIVDLAAEGTTSAEITRLALLFLAIAVATQILAVIVAWLATVAAWRTTNDLRLTMTRHVLGLDHEFHRTHTPGELIQRVDGDVTSVSDFLSTVVTKAAGAAMLVGGIIVVLFVLDWRLGLGMAVYVAARARGHRTEPTSGGLGIVRRDGRSRAALRRHRGTVDSSRGPPFQRRSRSRRMAVRRGQRGRVDERCSSRACLPRDVVVRPGGGRGGLGDRAGARCGPRRRRHHLDRYRLPAVPVRPAHRSPARGGGARTRDGAEGERCDGPRRRPARRGTQGARRR